MTGLDSNFNESNEILDPSNIFPPNNGSLLKRYQTLLQISKDGIHVVDKAGNIIEANDAFCNLLGYSKEEIFKVSLFEIDAFYSKEALPNGIEILINKGAVFQTKHRKKDGTLIDVEINAVGVNFDGVDYLYASSRDISSRIKDEILRNEALDHLNKIASRVPGALFQFELSKDGSFGFPYASESIRELYGVSPEQILNNAEIVFKKIYKDDFDRVMQSISVSAKNLTPWQEEFRLLDEDGTIRIVYGNSIPQKEPNGNILWHGIVTDISEQKRVEKSFIEISHRFKYLFDLHSTVMLLIDFESGTILDANISATCFYGYSKEQLQNMNIADINFLDKETVKIEMEKAVSEKRNYFLFKHKLANGELKDVEVHSTPVTINGKKTLFSVIHDISDRVKNEALVKEYTNKLQRVNSDLESFAYVASHDLKAPLNVVTGFLGLINNKKEALSNETRAEYLKYIQDAVDQMKLLINDLLQFSRIGSNKESLVEVDINLLLVSIQNILAETILQNNATIIIQPLPIILANKTLLNELLMNLLGNALKYHKRGQKLQIEIGYKDVGDKYQFFVKDNGIGIATENLEKVFVMFKRLHASSEFQGTGIGLSLCKRIVEAHGGEIWIESILGEGSTINFTIKK
jgi:PAS domain S-box-containing protein